MMRILADLHPADPRFGLAVDEVLFQAAHDGELGSIRFWINDRAVVIGRSQRVADEVDLAFAARERIPVLRRMTGGGAVYHYPGNLNLSVALPRVPGRRSVTDIFRFFGEAAAAALSPWVTVACGGNALRIEGRKVGGAAQARRGDAVLYHTTLLLSPDVIPMDRLLLALRPGYAPKRVASRPSSTVTLEDVFGNPVSVEDVVESVRLELEHRLETTGSAGSLTRAEHEQAELLVESKYGRDEWNRLN